MKGAAARTFEIAFFLAFFSPLPALAADATDPVLAARSPSAALSALGVSSTLPGNQIQLEVPDIVEAGSDFVLKLRVALKHADRVVVLAEKGAFPVVFLADLGDSLAPQFTLRIRLERTSRVRAIVRAEGKYYETGREVKVAYRDN